MPKTKAKAKPSKKIKTSGSKKPKRAPRPRFLVTPKPRPRDRELPGMEDMRIKSLDDICRSIADTREEINDLKGTEEAFEATALKEMRKHARVTWSHAGVTLIRKPGEEKLVVKNARTRQSTAEVESEPAQDAPEPAIDEGGGTPAPPESAAVPDAAGEPF